MTTDATSAALPTALTPWARQLAALDHGAAVALGPMVHRLDELIGRHTSTAGHGGLPDGFDGVTWRGRPERLLVSQWLLAQEVPDEFVRRAAAGELLHLAPALRHDAQRGQSALLVDCGPYLHGAPRLLQLVLALVLHRRATAAGHGFRLGVLHREPGSWLDGDLPELLEGWLKARATRPPDVGAVRAWLAGLDRPQDAWVVTTPPVAEQLADEFVVGPAAGRRPHVVTVTEADWTAAGPSGLAVGLPGERLHLPLPEPDVAVRILRGGGWRRRAALPRARVATGVARMPWFAGPAPVLMARGAHPGELVHQRVPGQGHAGRPARTCGFGGDVIAASAVGRRIVALVARDGMLAASVIGKRLDPIDRIAVPLDRLGLTDADILACATQRPAALYVTDGHLFGQLANGWWSLRPDGSARPRQDVLAVVAHPSGGSPGLIRSTARPGEDSPTSGHGPPDGVDPTSDVVVGAGMVAWRTATRIWQLLPVHPPGAPRPAATPDPGLPVTVPEGTRALGVVSVQGRAGIVAVSRAGLLVTFSTPDGTTTLTRWSGGTLAPVVHPLLPLIAVRRDDGSTEVGDLDTGRVRLRWDTAG